MPSGTTRDWPPLPFPEWAATRKTLHMYTQILGKIRLALSPPQPEWLGSCLHMTARGLTTGPMPHERGLLEVGLDLLGHHVIVSSSRGPARTISLLPALAVADVYAEVMGALAGLGVGLDLWTKPQEVAETTPLDQNRQDGTYEPDQVERFLHVLAAVQGVFDVWRSRFFGRTGLQFWWGAFDLAVLRFTGRRVEAPTDRGYIMRHDLDAEFMNAGFWPGGDDAPEPVFYAYIHPQPAGCSLAPVEPDAAAWVESMSEWMIPYERIRSSADPAGALLGFLDSVYRVAGSHGGWDLPGFEYDPPDPPLRRADLA
jgi:hypothetical protein